MRPIRRRRTPPEPSEIARYSLRIRASPGITGWTTPDDPAVLRRPLRRASRFVATVGVMQPTWRRLATGTGALFVVILAFLAGRVHGGGDPALRDAAGAQPASAPALQQDPQVPDPEVAPPTTRAS